VTIGVSVPAATHGWTGGVNYFAQKRKAAQEDLSNVDFVFASAPDAPKQIADIEDMVSTTQHRCPGHPAGRSGRDDLGRSSRSRMPASSSPSSTASCRSTASRTSMSPATIRAWAPTRPSTSRQALPEGGNIVILRGMPIPIDQQRFDAFHGRIEGTNINVLDDEFANWNRDDGFEVMQDFLTRFPDIKAVWAQDDDIALGAIEAIKQAGRESEMFVVGGAGMQQIVQARGGWRSSSSPSMSATARHMIATAIELTTSHFTGGIQVAGRYILDSTLITKDNASEYLDDKSPF
jgi:ribose transport system substrate-binding protein